MLVVALTGGIGSGKSTACRLFAQLGVPIVDTDLIAREAVRPGQPALDEIVALFGRSVLNPRGELDRTRMRQLIFNDDTKKQQLESILHPRIRAETKRQIAALDTAYCVVAIPLLIETEQLEIAERILVIDCPESEQIRRVTERDGQTENEVRSIITAQATRAERLAVAHDVIQNDGDLQHLRQQVQKLHKKYLLASGAD